MPKSRDDRMIRGYSINMLHLIDVAQRFQVMDLIVETIKRTAASQKRSCGFAPHIQMLINAKFGMGKYLLDREHLPLRPELEDNEVVMDQSHPTSQTGQAKIVAAKAAMAAKKTAPGSSSAKKVDQMTLLLDATQRIEQSLASM